MPNNNFWCKIWKGLQKPQQWNTTDQKEEQDKPQLMMVKFQNGYKVYTLYDTGAYERLLALQIHESSIETSQMLWTYTGNAIYETCN